MQPKLIAFHLPQFHPIPENDAWWGKGFTEWTNVTRATPRFPGHHQPQLPTDLGFYDLRLPEARAAQAELAREYGIHGFCYYHYWFNGKRLLERPVEEILASGEPDFPFCLCWANENWTRRWDGAEKEVLIGQNYNDDDDREHIQYLIKAFRDPRYIRVDGKPLILIYRARHLPDPKRTTTIWRNEARKAGIGEIFICRVENFFNERDDPHVLGFDASVDFQPDWKAISDENPSVVLPDEHFVVDYRDMVESQLDRPDVPHLRFPGVTPSWDNSARRKKNAFILADSSPEAYEYWLTETLRNVSDRPESQQLVFINAWNEWAEGNHLEPDQKFGRGYLEATRRALETASAPPTLKHPPLLDPLTHDGFVPRETCAKRLAAQRLSKAAAILHDQRLSGCIPPHIRIVLDATLCSDDALQQSLNSVAGQLYEHWQLEVLSQRPAPNIASSRLGWHTIEPQHAAAATARLVETSGDDWHLVFAGGEVLAEDALLFASQTLIDAPDACLVLTDGDTRDADGKPVRTWLAPGINPDWLRSTLRIGGLVIASTRVMREALEDIGDSPTNALPLAAVLRAIEDTDGRHCHHLSRIALSRPAGGESIPLGFRAQLLQAHLGRQGLSASVEHGLLEDSCRIRYEHERTTPSIAVAISAPGPRDLLLRSVEGILSHPATAPLSILLPLTPDCPADIRECLQQLAALGSPGIRVVEVTTGSPTSVANQLAAATEADVLLFLGSGLIPLDADWLDALVGHALRPGVGAVGGRVIAPDGSLRHGMIRLGQMGVAATPLQDVSAGFTGNGGELQLEQNCSAVSIQYLTILRETFLGAGGFAADRYPAHHAELDLCLRLGEQGLRTVWTPFSTVVAPAPRPAPSFAPPERDDEALLEDWLERVPVDPYFNRQLTRHFNRPRLQTDVALAQDALPWHPVPRIYAHPADMTGCGEIRISTPLRALDRASLIQGGGGIRFLGPWELATLAPDTIVTQRIFSDLGLSWLAAYRKFSRGLLIYELDDLITRIPHENEHGRGFPTDIEARIRKAIGLCDRLVVSTEALADAYSRFANETVVAPNLLDDAIWGDLQRISKPGERPRIGWAGSTSHGGDLVLMHDVIRNLSDEVDWVFLGFCPDALRPFVREFHPPVAIKDYPAALARLGLDIAIAPLAANAFNEAKSNLKLLEYGALGYPVVCSNVLPYQGNLPVVRVANTTQQWVAALRRLLSDADERRSLGDALQAEVRSNWMIDARRAEWLSAWTR
jgi:glycosyltransferase involved in cell wall biosynthesis